MAQTSKEENLCRINNGTYCGSKQCDKENVINCMLMPCSPGGKQSFPALLRDAHLKQCHSPRDGGSGFHNHWLETYSLTKSYQASALLLH